MQSYALPHPRSRRNNLDLASGLLGGFAMAPKRKASVAASDGDAQDRRFRDLYAEPPDFRDLGRRDPDFAAVYVLWQAVGMRADGSQDKGPRAGLLRSQVRRATDQDAAQARLWPRDRAPGRQALPARTHHPFLLKTSLIRTRSQTGTTTSCGSRGCWTPPPTVRRVGSCSGWTLEPGQAASTPFSDAPSDRGPLSRPVSPSPGCEARSDNLQTLTPRACDGPRRTSSPTTSDIASAWLAANPTTPSCPSTPSAWAPSTLP